MLKKLALVAFPFAVYFITYQVLLAVSESPWRHVQIVYVAFLLAIVLEALVVHFWPSIASHLMHSRENRESRQAQKAAERQRREEAQAEQEAQAAMEAEAEAKAKVGEFFSLSSSLPEELQGYIQEISANLEKAEAGAMGNEAAQMEIHAFKRKYLLAGRDMLKSYLLQGEAERQKDDVDQTLRLLSVASGRLVENLQRQSEDATDSSQAYIEKSLMEDGLIDPGTEVIDRWK